MWHALQAVAALWSTLTKARRYDGRRGETGGGIRTTRVSCIPVCMAPRRTRRLTITLDGRHAHKLSVLARERHMHDASLARVLLASAIDEAELDPIPGAWEREQKGMAEIRAGKGIPPLDELGDALGR